ncbi:MAG: cation:proton antiporter [archaeon]|jgi:cell volume regulation protein A
MVNVEFAFLTLGLVIFAGYFSLSLFKKTKISEIIILLIIGLFIGPISSLAGFGFLGPDELLLFENFLPFFASFALIMILFEGGLQLNFFKTLKALPESFIFTLVVFLTNMILTIGVLWLLGAAGLLPFNLLLAIFIAAVIGGTSSAVIIPIIKNTSAKEETKTLLGLESALTDALCVITAIAVGEIFLIGSVSIETVFGGILANFSTAAILGFIVGILWLKILAFLQGRQYEYLITFAALLMLYSLVQVFGGNGAIAVLIFGIVLGNSEDITQMLRITKRSVDTNIKSFQSEISFLVKTFFFVYLGLLFKLEFLNPAVIVISLAIIIIIFISRYLVSSLLKKINPIYTMDQMLISFMSARGLAAAVLVSLPISMGLDKAVPLVFSTATMSQLSAIAFIVIFGSNVLTTIGIFITENGKPVTSIKEERNEMLTEIKATDIKINKLKAKK